MLGSGKSPGWTGAQLSAAAGGAVTANDSAPTIETDAARSAYAARRRPDPDRVPRCRCFLDTPEKSNKGSFLDFDHFVRPPVAATPAAIVATEVGGLWSRTWEHRGCGPLPPGVMAARLGGSGMALAVRGVGGSARGIG